MKKIHAIVHLLCVLLVLINLLNCSSLGGCKIIAISSIKEAQAYFENADCGTLCIFDVDSTLTTPSDADLRRHAIRRHRAIYDELVSPLTPHQKRIFEHLLVMASPSILVEHEFPEIIYALQKKGVRTIAFTAAKTGSVGKMPSFPEWRYQELKRFGIDFSEIFPKSILFTKLRDYGKDHPGMEKGIVYSGCRCDKGEVLKIVLEDISWLFDDIQEIIFIDDKEENVRLFARVLNERCSGVNFIGFYYKGIEAMPSSEVSPIVFRQKISQLVEKTKEICPG